MRHRDSYRKREMYLVEYGARMDLAMEKKTSVEKNSAANLTSLLKKEVSSGAATPDLLR